MLRARLCLALATVFFLIGCATLRDSGQALQRFEFEEPRMGVPFRIVLFAPSKEIAERAATAAFDRIADLNAIMSDYETDSELSILSRSSEEGAPEVRLSPELWTVLDRAQRLARESEGAFDVTIGPCAALWRKARREREFPDRARLENAFNKVGHENLVLNRTNRSAQLRRFGMRLDLGAIAKGYAADEALKTLREHGIRRALVAASGDLVLGDPPPGEKGWRVELIGSDAPGASPSRIARLANRAVATSGDLFQRLELNGIRYSHVLDPRTCIGMTNHALATVIADDGMTADSLATTLTILGREEGLALAERYKAAARIIRIENETPVVFTNRRFRQVVSD